MSLNNEGRKKRHHGDDYKIGIDSWINGQYCSHSGEPDDILVREQSGENQPLILISVAEHGGILVCKVEQQLHGIQFPRVGQPPAGTGRGHYHSILAHAHEVLYFKVSSSCCIQDAQLHHFHLCL